MQLGARSIARLQGIHPDLRRWVDALVERCTTEGIDFAVLEGLRTIARQRELVLRGASQTLDSRHLTGHAVDLGVWVGDQVDWHWELYAELARHGKAVAAEQDVPVEWGGDWTRFRDGPHFQLSRAAYPA